MTLIDQAKQMIEGVQTLKDWLGSGAETVPWKDAQRRANVCVRCPMNQPGNAATGAIGEAIKKQVELKNSLNLRVVGEKSLLHCAACSCVLKLKIWLPITKLGLSSVADLDKFDQGCWMRKEFQNP